MNKSMLNFLSKSAIVILCILGLTELALAMWTVFDNRYRSLAYTLADVGYIDLWILRYLSLCLFASSIITIVMCLILIWGLYSAHVFLFIASTMITLVVIAEFTISILTFTSKYETRLTLTEQLPKLVITYRQGNDERANRALDILQSTFRCCGSDGRLSFQNNVPLSCNMYSVGCHTRTMFYLDTCIDALAYLLLFFSLIKLFIVLFFYSFLCLYQKYRPKSRRLVSDSRIWRHSSSFDSSSTDNLPKKLLTSSTMTNQDENNNHDNEYVAKRRVILNDYEPSTTDKRIATTTIISASNNNELNTCYDQHVSRKLSSISEKTEKTETDDSEPDLLRLKQYHPKRRTIFPSANQKQYPPPIPKKLPIIKNRRKTVRDDENDNDSGVERSSSEKSFDDHNIHKQYFDTSIISATNEKPKQTNTKSPSSLGYSKIFVTSVSQTPPREEQSPEDELKNPLISSNHLVSNDTITPRPILKKSNYRDPKDISSVRISLLHNTPKTIPRSSLKQSKQDESLV